MKVVIPDLVSNSYFPAIAAVEMGFFKEEGLDAEHELIYPVGKCYEALRDGKVDFVGGSSHSAPTAFPEWQGDMLVGALKFELLVRLEMDGQQITGEERMLEGELGRIRDVRVGPDGLVSILNDEDEGGVYRLEPAG